MPPVPFFDGHNDALFRLSESRGADPHLLFLNGRADGHIDLPRAREGEMVGGLFALYAPSKSGLDLNIFKGKNYDCPLPPEVPLPDASRIMMRQIAILLRAIAASNGSVSLCRTVADIRDARQRSSFAAVLHMEGAEAIDADLDMLDVLHAVGLRSIGPVWSRNNVFGHGVPMRFPSSPDAGPGLTDAGKRLVRACNDLRIMIDLSHLTERGFWDVARLTNAPLVATHSNVHDLSPSSRNLTRRQLDAIRDSDGIVGLNLATCFLRSDGQMDEDTPIGVVVQHVEALIEHLGETRVAIGSDFDGAVVPKAIGSVAGAQAIFSALRAKGFDEPLIEKIAISNWLRVLRQTIG
ncbi:dipeptidase [Bradyrhizobium sp. BR 10289]|uniref:dipeptidase n=1 Tax=Bradyrhizobium sp. BR 10289 TaxID=2749993 RepID=UPI001C647A68|nr:dipeptidase [Bradyrhizobium sp. BR 10289]MBW7970198.1 membrane dipeptidase [Bradyrhizobium sp. BR 10289]